MAPQTIDRAVDYKYWAFISYSHADNFWARWLHRGIESYRVPRALVGKPSRDGTVPRRLYPVFRDREELPISADLGANIKNALEASRYLIVICSPQAANSRWVNEEIRYFKSLRVEDRVLCKMLATGGWDRTIRLWDINTGKSKTIAQPAGKVLSVNFSPAGTSIVAGCWNGYAYVYDLNGQLLATLDGHRGRVNYAAFSSDGKRIVTASDDYTARIWSADGTPLLILRDHTDSVKPAVYSADGSRILTAAYDGTARVWDSSSGQLLLTVKTANASQTELNFAAFNPNGDRIATVGLTPKVFLWDVNGRMVATFKFNHGRVNFVQFGPTGDLLAAVHAEWKQASQTRCALKHMTLDTVDDIEAALRSDQVSIRVLHGVWEQRRPILDPAEPKSGRNRKAEAPQVDWLRSDGSLPYYFTKRALEKEEFLLVCDAAREALRLWNEYDEQGRMPGTILNFWRKRSVNHETSLSQPFPRCSWLFFPAICRIHPDEEAVSQLN